MKMVDLVERFRNDFTAALREALAEVAPGEPIDAHELYRALHRKLGGRLNKWTAVPAGCARADDRQ